MEAKRRETMTAGEELPVTINRLAGAFRDGTISCHDRAQLRRLDPRRADQAAFWRVLATLVAPYRAVQPAEETAWAIIVSGMARMFPWHHQPGLSAGGALSSRQFPETRLMKFLNCSPDEDVSAFRHLAGFLASRQQPVDWSELAALVLSDRPSHREARHRKIAWDFYDLSVTAREAP